MKKKYQPTVFIDTIYNDDKKPKPWHCDLTCYNVVTMHFDIINVTDSYATAKEAKQEARKIAIRQHYTILGLHQQDFIM